MRTTKLLIFFVMSLFFVTCSKEEPKEILSKDKTITKIIFNTNPKVTAIVNDITKKITATVPVGTDLTAITLGITHSGASISPNPKTPQNFSGGREVPYTVTAKDGTTQIYKVSISLAKELSNTKTITKASIISPNTEMDINDITKEITATVPFDTGLRAITLSITYKGVSISPLPSEPQDFSTGEVTYTVTAENGSVQDYAMSISLVKAKTENLITQLILTLAGIHYTGEIDQGTNTILFKDVPAIPRTATIKNIVLFDLASASAGIGEQLNINNNSATITITAQNGDQRIYTINFLKETDNSIIKATMAWVSIREGVIELESSIANLDMSVIVSRESTAPAYETIKDLPGFYTRKSKGEGVKRTVYLSMTDKMTAAMMDGPKVPTGLDGSVTGFNPLTEASELLHPNTTYYAYIYYQVTREAMKTSKIEFKTDAFPATFPKAADASKNGATWSAFYAKNNTSPKIEHKAGEKYLVPHRVYHDINDFFVVLNLSDALKIGFLLTGTKSPHHFPLVVSAISTKLYYMYNIAPNGPSAVPKLWDLMVGNNVPNFSVFCSTSIGLRQYPAKGVLLTKNNAILVTD